MARQDNPSLPDYFLAHGLFHEVMPAIPPLGEIMETIRLTLGE